MRDVLVVGIVTWMCMLALKRPWIGVMLWNWLSIMNPHRYTYGFAYGAPLAQASALVTFVGMLVSKDERKSPFKSAAVVLFFCFMVWMTLSWLAGLDVDGDFSQWSKVMKVDLMVMVGMAVLWSKKHVVSLAWVSAGSLMLLGAKGGVFSLLGGGTERVWGPPGSFIEDNNEFGLALIICIPILRFLQLQLRSRAGRWAMGLGMLLCALAAVATQSRGALLAISVMALALWVRGSSKVMGGILIASTALTLLAFMPDSWLQRMHTIESYEQDGSAQGRLAAWSAAWGIAMHYPLGVGFNQVRQELFDKYSHNPEAGARAAHSIYFQVLGNHGFIGLALFVGIFMITWRHAGWLRKHAKAIPEARWCVDLGSMVQVSLIGFAVGGAFLSLAYFDLPYNLMMMIAVARLWVMNQAWQREPVETGHRFAIPGLAAPARP